MLLNLLNSNFLVTTAMPVSFKYSTMKPLLPSKFNKLNYTYNVWNICIQITPTNNAFISLEICHSICTNQMIFSGAQVKCLVGTYVDFADKIQINTQKMSKCEENYSCFSAELIILPQFGSDPRSAGYSLYLSWTTNKSINQKYFKLSS